MKYSKLYRLCYWLFLLPVGNMLFAQEAKPKVTVENVVTINTNKLDFSPAFFQEGIVFVSNRKRPKSAKKITDHKDEFLGDNFMSLYYAARNEEGYTVPEEFSVNITTRYHEGPVSFTKEGTRIFFTRNDYKDGRIQTNRKGDTLLKIYTATKNGNDWTSITELPFNDAAYDQCHPAISADGKTLLFSSNKEGGYGGMDLYKSEFLNGQWSTPVNLGAPINTAKNEVFPFYHGDGTLYFASNGHGGHGGLDIFSTTYTGSFWKEPTNVESPINSLDDDFGYILDPAGKSGYFSSARRKGLGKDDIYRFSIASVNKAPSEEVLTEKGFRKIIAGTVSDGVGGERLVRAKVSLVNRRNGQKMSTLTDDKGEFAFRSTLLSPDHALQISKEGYNAYSEDINIVQLSNESRAVKEYFFILNPQGYSAPPPPAAVPVVNTSPSPTPTPVVSTPTPSATPPAIPVMEKKEEVITYTSGMDKELAVGTKLVLEEILFDYGSFDLQIGALPTLDNIAALLRKYPKMGIELSAHTDSRGNASYNERLSRRRAESVVSYFIQNGIQPNRLIPIGSGEAAVRNGCVDGVPCSESQHKMNRRIEMKMIQLLGF